MRKIFVSFFFFLLLIVNCYAQFDVQMSQYMLNNSFYNPAFIGEGDLVQLTGQIRNQWLGMPNAGVSSIVGANAPIKFGSENFGVGVRLLKDAVGLFTQQNMYTQFAYKKKIEKSMLSFGIDVGIISMGFNGTKVKTNFLPGDDFHSSIASDPLIPKTEVQGTSLDLCIGGLFSTPQYYAGLSVASLNAPVIAWENNEIKRQPSFFLTGGYNWTLTDPKYVVKPSMLFKTSLSTYQIDLSARLEYDNKYWGGLSCRVQDAIVVLGGLNLAGGLSVGYSYDLPTTQIISVSSGTHEVFLNYSFAFVTNTRVSKYKSIRYL